MMNLAEYRRRSQSLADFLPWAALVEKGVILNKDGSFQRTARFRGPDLDSATPGRARRDHRPAQQRVAPPRLRLGDLHRGAAPAGQPLSARASFPTPPPVSSMPSAARSSRRKARISRAGIS